MDRKKKSNEQKIIWSRILIILVIVISIGFVVYWIYPKIYDKNEVYTLEDWEVILLDRSDLISENEISFELAYEEKKSCKAPIGSKCPLKEKCADLYNLNCILSFRNDPELCESIKNKDSKHNCMAGMNEDPNECEKIENLDLKIACLAYITRDVKYCEQFSDETIWSSSTR